MGRFRALLVGCLLVPGFALGAAPVIDALTAPASLLPEAAGTVSVEAHSTDGAALAYAWTTTAGQITGSGPSVTLTAPATYGKVTVTATVTSAADGTTAAKTATVNVALATFRGSLKHESHAVRLSSASTGELYALDGKSGELSVLTRRGDLKGTARLNERAVSVAQGPSYIFVALASGKLAKIDPKSGKLLGTIDLLPPIAPVGMAWDAANGRLWTVNHATNEVRVLSPDGAVLFTVSTAAGVPLRGPMAVAIDAAGALAWVAVQTSESGNALHAYDLNGGYLRSTLAFGTTLGKVTRVGGVSVDASGNAWVADAFLGVVQTVTRTGQPVSIVGRYGAGPGDLRLPSDVATMINGDMVVASSDRGKLERYGRGAALPVCTGDSDCDGVADSWELAHGMNPNDASDAWLDPDGNGLTNQEEYLASVSGQGATATAAASSGATPSAATGAVSDAAFVSVVASSVESGPGLVSLSASVTSSDACSISWKQAGGPPVALRGATTLAPAFVARAAGTYRFTCAVTCRGKAAAPVVVDAFVSNVTPRPDAGRTVVVQAPADVVLDGSLSSDANADALALRWDQVLGAPLTAGAEGPLLAVSPPSPGYFEFMLTATDPRGAEATAQAPLLALAPGAAGPTAVAPTPLQARVGANVVLDASGSHASPTARYVWSQVAGAPVSLSDPASPVATFVPSAPGRYAFELYVRDGAVRSPATLVDVYVAPRASSLPTAVARASGTPRLGTPITLDATASSGSAPLSYAWRIVSGPASGLTGADQAVATLVPFDSGTFVLELAVSDRGTPGVPARVRIDVPLPDGTLPVAIAQAPDATATGAVVQLDGSRSTGSGQLRYRWTQVGGPWVALDDAGAARPWFAAKVAGVYEFELEVLDGNVRSAPARVRVATDDGAAR